MTQGPATATIKTRLCRFFPAISGMAAAEFGLLLPVFALCLVAMIDVGLGINERMYLDRVLRSGAQLAMGGVQEISELENAVASSSDPDPETQEAPTVDTIDYSLNITRSCECAGVGGSCTDRCAGGEPPSLFYNFSASQMMQTMLLPQFEVESKLRVQVR